jgi:hypothetical protein
MRWTRRVQVIVRHEDKPHTEQVNTESVRAAKWLGCCADERHSPALAATT